ncbi:hypothetical protein [Paenibacillus qinlingensis]|uniref:hypothetical protein n=1 Tax=Paenibacillus qinlingensis TaxID=1837343 RepID=UPI0015674AB8|nr:hypothetical protein [Paenibacillus qinlingensis]NQX63977.1 hypothetical protein [Paenibacillus qinlingensis]
MSYASQQISNVIYWTARDSTGAEVIALRCVSFFYLLTKHKEDDSEEASRHDGNCKELNLKWKGMFKHG